MFRIDSHLLKVLRDGGYSTSDIEEIKRRLNAEPHYLAGLRDEFAKAAIPVIYTGLCSMLKEKGASVDNVYEIVALAAYEQADAMIAARGKGGAV
jgi:hypothetical protein